MKYYENIHEITLENENYRKVLCTTENMQLVVMCLKPQEETGIEQHVETSQFIKIISGSGKITIDGIDKSLTEGVVVIIHPDTLHNIINTNEDESLKLFTIYSPPLHPEGLVQPEKPIPLISKKVNSKYVSKNITNIIYYK